MTFRLWTIDSVLRHYWRNQNQLKALVKYFMLQSYNMQIANSLTEVLCFTSCCLIMVQFNWTDDEKELLLKENEASNSFFWYHICNKQISNFVLYWVQHCKMLRHVYWVPQCKMLRHVLQFWRLGLVTIWILACPVPLVPAHLLYAISRPANSMNTDSVTLQKDTCKEIHE